MCILIRLNYEASENKFKIQRMKPQHMQRTRIDDISAGAGFIMALSTKDKIPVYCNF